MASKQGKIEALLSYMPKGVGSRFEEKQVWEMPAVSVPITLKIETPQEIINGEKISFKINYENTGDVDLENLYLEVTYPKDFSYEKSSIEPDSKKNVWNLDSLRKGSAGSLSIFGKLCEPRANATYRSTISPSLKILSGAETKPTFGRCVTLEVIGSSKAKVKILVVSSIPRN